MRNIDEFFSELTTCAKILNNEHLTNIITKTIDLQKSTKAKILILGSSNSGRASLCNCLLNTNSIPVSSIPKSELPIELDYSDHEYAELVFKNNIKKLLDKSELKQYMLSSSTHSPLIASIKLYIDSNALKNYNIRIDSIKASYDKDTWKEIMISHDYIIFMLKAPALLSEDEKIFIKNIIINSFDLDKIIFLINQIDLIEDNEIDSVISYVKTFLANFSAKATILPSSLLQSQDIQKNLLHKKILANLGTVKHKNFLDAITICIDTMEMEVNRQLKIKSFAEENILKISQELDAKASWFNTRIDRIKNKINAFINTIIKEELLREVEDFNIFIKNQLPIEIDSIGSAELIKKFLPLYIENLWKEFFEFKCIKINQTLNTELLKIKKEIQEDFIKFFNDNEIDIDEALSMINITNYNMITNIHPARNENLADKVATGFGMLGIGLILFNLPLGLASMGGGHLLRKVFNNSITESDIQAIKNTLDNSLNDLLKSIEDSLNQTFNNYSNALTDEISKLYLNAINTLKSEFEENIKKYTSIKENGDNLSEILNQTIPNLRNSLKEWGEYIK